MSFSLIARFICETCEAVGVVDCDDLDETYGDADRSIIKMHRPISEMQIPDGWQLCVGTPECTIVCCDACAAKLQSPYFICADDMTLDDDDDDA
jgi:hypothetical protein